MYCADPCTLLPLPFDLQVRLPISEQTITDPPRRQISPGRPSQVQHAHSSRDCLFLRRIQGHSIQTRGEGTFWEDQQDSPIPDDEGYRHSSQGHDHHWHGAPRDSILRDQAQGFESNDGAHDGLEACPEDRQV